MARKDASAAGGARGSWRQRLGLLAGTATVLLVAVLVRYYWGPGSAAAQNPLRAAPRATAPKTAATPRTAPKKTAANPAASADRGPRQTMAVVNGKEISRAELAKECVRRHGAEVLESLVNKYLITLHCKKHNVTVTREEINAEIESTAKRFRLATDQWLQMLEKERGISPEQYARDIVWPTIALRKLAAGQLTVTREELQKAYESYYGPAVQARIISLNDLDVARKLRAQLKAQPQEFPRLAREYSQDISSASLGGMIQPIRHHLGDKKIEEVVFSLKEGEISPIIRVADQYVILKCEGHLPARNFGLEAVRPQLEAKIRDRKLHTVGGQIFQKLQKNAVVENVFNDPVKSRQMPGVAATINGHPIPLSELAEECIARYGEEVLEGKINRALLQGALVRAGIEVTRQDLDAEIAHAALLSGIITPEGKPDLERWKGMTVQQGGSWELYIRDTVWPSAALKKLVEGRVEVTQEDLQKGYEANYGKKVRCRAIVMSNLRRAQEVWDLARREPTAEHFGDLAAQYSVEASSRALRGEVPPIGRHGGQQMLEDEAFKLRKGEISKIIQLGGNYVILFCEGFTTPIEVEMREVRDLLYTDLHEKKIRLAMAERFQKIRDGATIDNYLTGTSQSPKKAIAAQPAAPVRR